MSVKVKEAFCFDSFQDRLLYWDDFHGDQLKDEWNEAGTGSATVIDAQTGGIVRITTGATNGNSYRIDWQDYRSLLVTKKVTAEFRVKVNQSTALTVNFNLYFDVSNRITFTMTNGGNWNIQCTNGGATTGQDSGIASDTNYHIFRIEAFPTDEVHFYIDGVECANSPITTNIPDDAADYLQPRLYIITAEDVAKTMDIDYCYLRQER